ncbi:MAG: SpoIIE family protein phosphatase [Gammaproteobacteria bacterium]|nr:SpoIIE family protein phosphatase [Gammaproteobacteria bacterium]NVK89063.1 SpoIIE family protein phosphatase [Gammaproteobacteria bacterium]
MDTDPLFSTFQDLDTENITILTIEDDVLVRQSFVMYLEDYGFSVLEADNGCSGLAAFRQHQPDLVLCDIRMPEMNGMAVLEQITKESPDTPVIMISGAGMINDVVESLKLGAHDYIVKPVTDLDVLGHAVKQALSKKALESENQRFKHELERANLELQSNLDVLREDQEAGRRAQLQLLPPPEQKLGNYEFLHTVIPSLNVSGDFLDYFEIDERYLGFYIADVSGHGSASAFVTMMLKSLFNQPIRQYRVANDPAILSPAKVLEYLNQEVMAANVGKHVTLFYGVIDTQDHQLTYSIAGHYPRPIMMRGAVKELLEVRGFPIGMFDWATFTDHQVDFDEAMSLIMFSDGVLECLQQNEVVPEHCLLDIIIRPNSTILEITQQLNLDAQNGLPDDVSVFVVRRHDHQN